MVQRPYGTNNVFTFQCGWGNDRYIENQLPQPDSVTGYEQYDLGIVEVDEEGDLADAAQLQQIRTRIHQARTECSNGAIVVTFIHGWHNNADWDNANLVSFRRLLRSLMMREMEALHRRVIGVYVGWNGTPTDGAGRWLARLPGLKHATFQNRYATAGTVGSGEAMSESLVGLTTACKSDDPLAIPSPLILIGHSMGAFILQTAFRELMANSELPLVSPAAGSGPVSLHSASAGAVLAPDLLLSLNSAAEADVARDIVERAATDRWEKRFDPGSSLAPYNPPVLVSATSEADQATNWVWRAGHFFQKPSTDGHDPALATHTFTCSEATPDCAPAGPIDFGQPWHCLHKDSTAAPTPRFQIDLPDHDRSSDEPMTHTAYDLVPFDADTPRPFWLFQVPGDVIADHSDIFNFKAASFVLGLIGISGVLASAAGTSWTDNFSELPLS